MRRIFAILMTVALGAGPALAQDGAGYRIGPNDVLDVDVYGEPDLSASYEVTSDGTLVMPFADPMSVKGLSTTQIAEVVTNRYLEGILINPQVTVRVAEHRSQQVEVYGAVKNPGRYYLEGPTKLTEILGSAGWIDAQKSSRHVVIRRQTGEAVALSIDEVMKGGEANLPLRGGDVVSVEEGQVVYVGGEVEQAGPVVFSEGLTVMQALLKAGGPSETARLRGAYVMRDGERLPINLKRVSDGRESDLVMRPGDQLFLKESPL